MESASQTHVAPTFLKKIQTKELQCDGRKTIFTRMKEWKKSSRCLKEREKRVLYEYNTVTPCKNYYGGTPSVLKQLE